MVLFTSFTLHVAVSSQNRLDELHGVLLMQQGWPSFPHVATHIAFMHTSMAEQAFTTCG